MLTFNETAQMNSTKNVILLFFMYNIAAVYSMDAGDINELKKWTQTLKSARILNSSLLVPIPPESYKIYIKELLEVSNPKLSDEITNHLVKHANESNWPNGISTKELRDINKEHMDKYKCRLSPRKIQSRQLVIVLASENEKLIPEDMTAVPAFIMVFEFGGLIAVQETYSPALDGLEIDTSGTDVSQMTDLSDLAKTLKPATVVFWGGVRSPLYGPLVEYQNSVRGGLVNWPPEFVDELVKKLDEKSWPPGLADGLTRKDNQIYLDKLNCRRLPFVRYYQYEEAVIVFASDNPTMSEEFIDKKAFVMFFSKGSTVDKEVIVIPRPSTASFHII
ncbi:uncharacterized protein LOC126843820 [Adelges cooleyi]|uniref:uncharacterized protein LOC126843820 n=1 Tax=Adelges cooleyi TaxID=133065 RepID=UPI00217F56BA|nr:uncharacterized protein LOC126843820 [Adelges cooleyi]